MKKLLFALLLLIAIAGGVYYFVMNKPHKDVNDEKAIEISAAQLFVEFTANEQVANSKYLNKALKVTGVVTTIEENQDKKKYIVLQSDDLMYGVMCTMRANDFNVQKGETITIKGFCSGYVGDVKLTDCVISFPPNLK